ncbi:MAG: hypothetical protein ACRD2C_12295 [Acidimicrobiales bacterium]
MDREKALDQIAGTYASALRLADAGHRNAEIAAELGIDEAAVPSLLRIGTAKLAHLMADDSGAGTDAPGTDDERHA